MQVVLFLAKIKGLVGITDKGFFLTQADDQRSFGLGSQPSQS
jgi:hypothetical protein